MKNTKLYVLASTSNPAAAYMVGKLVYVFRHIETNMAVIVDAKTGKKIWMTTPVCESSKKEGISLLLTTKNNKYFFVEVHK